MYITLDDNAEYGFNIAESLELKSYVINNNLTGIVKIYPGADEVQFSLLSAYTCDLFHISPTFTLVFRDPTTIQSIPNYEGQPMIQTLLQQISAAGGNISDWNNNTIPTPYTSDVTLLVNNFSEKQQLEATEQPMTSRSIHDYTMFDPFLPSATNGHGNTVIGFADNRYSNGADNIILDYMKSRHENTSHDLDINYFAYAGWNTGTEKPTIRVYLCTIALLLVAIRLFSHISVHCSLLLHICVHLFNTL